MFARRHFVQGTAATLDGETIQQPLTLTLRDLKEGFEQVEIAAVCQCW